MIDKFLKHPAPHMVKRKYCNGKNNTWTLWG